MSGHQPEERELFEKQAAGLYDAAVREGGLAEDDPRLVEQSEQRPAFDVLVGFGLLQLEDGRWRAVEPTAAQARVVGPLGVEGARLLEESARWAQVFHELANSWRSASAEEPGGDTTYVHGDAIDPYLTGLVAECQTELLTAQPQSGRQPHTIAAAALRDTDALDRGVSMRILYQHSARRHATTHKYVAAVTSRGAEVRTLDEFFNRMIILDRRVAAIPGADSLQTAAVVREPAVVAFLVDMFERAWARARPFASKETALVRTIAAEQRAMTIRMLIEGHSDAISARRLGVSPRTYAGYVADLRNEYQAATRFQLGYTMGKLGITGDEIHEDGQEEEG